MGIMMLCTVQCRPASACVIESPPGGALRFFFQLQVTVKRHMLSGESPTAMAKLGSRRSHFTYSGVAPRALLYFAFFSLWRCLKTAKDARPKALGGPTGGIDLVPLFYY